MAKEVKVETKVETRVEVKAEKKVCENCNGSGKQCSVCTPVFVDTFGK